MTAIVVFESMFGNTQQIAMDIAEGLRPFVEVSVLEVGQAPAHLDERIDLIVVGGPTHAFGMTRPSTRADATEQANGALISRGVGIREWLEALPDDHRDVSVATFDTRIDKVRRLPGSAARGAAKALRRHGDRVITKPESFYVTDMTGPLVDGERLRAQRWGEELGRLYRATQVRSTG
ncbi:MAG TPA: hypothetical protein VFQ15_11055 [Jiangellaceae bacterium]|nr:hypothetical protein [Jiangellaceae bacterium]